MRQWKIYPPYDWPCLYFHCKEHCKSYSHIIDDLSYKVGCRKFANTSEIVIQYFMNRIPHQGDTLLTYRLGDESPHVSFWCHQLVLMPSEPRKALFSHIKPAVRTWEFFPCFVKPITRSYVSIESSDLESKILKVMTSSTQTFISYSLSLFIISIGCPTSDFPLSYKWYTLNHWPGNFVWKWPLSAIPLICRLWKGIFVFILILTNAFIEFTGLFRSHFWFWLDWKF